jgi:hypothetical protein
MQGRINGRPIGVCPYSIWLVIAFQTRSTNNEHLRTEKVDQQHLIFP